MQDSISYLKACGIDKRRGDLLYKLLNSGYYLVAYINRDIDLFLCNWLPESHEQTSDEGCVESQILGFRINNSDKLKMFKKMLDTKKGAHL